MRFHCIKSVIKDDIFSVPGVVTICRGWNYSNFNCHVFFCTGIAIQLMLWHELAQDPAGPYRMHVRVVFNMVAACIINT